MIRKNLVLKIDLDVTEFVAAMNRAVRALRGLGRALSALDMTAGDRHIDRIARDCVARRLSAEVTARRLMVACDAAALLDGKTSPA